MDGALRSCRYPLRDRLPLAVPPLFLTHVRAAFLLCIRNISIKAHHCKVKILSTLSLLLLDFFYHCQFCRCETLWPINCVYPILMLGVTWRSSALAANMGEGRIASNCERTFRRNPGVGGDAASLYF